MKKLKSDLLSVNRNLLTSQAPVTTLQILSMEKFCRRLNQFAATSLSVGHVTPPRMWSDVTAAGASRVCHSNVPFATKLLKLITRSRTVGFVRPTWWSHQWRRYCKIYCMGKELKCNTPLCMKRFMQDSNYSDGQLFPLSLWVSVAHARVCSP